MKIFVLFLAVSTLSACGRAAMTRFSPVEAVVMRDADHFVLLVRDPGTGEVRPRRVFAEEVVIVADVPPGGELWAEHVDRPGELRGEGDTLILHVRSLADIE